MSALRWMQSPRAFAHLVYFDPLYYRIGEAALHSQRAARAGFRDLWDAEVRVFSQWGEDGILDFLCDSLGLDRPTAVEFGVGNYRECNTRFLAEHRLASVFAVDARADLAPTMKGLDIYWRSSLWPVVEWITPESAPRTLARARETMGSLDIVSLDIDGNDYWVAESLDFTGVQIVVLEYNPLFGATRAVTVPRDDQFDRATAHSSCLYFGASLRAWMKLMGERGYAFVGTNRAGNNAFFCPVGRLADIALPRPDLGNLQRYVEWRVRESRSEGGALTFLAGNDRIVAMGEMPLIDLDTGDSITVLQAQDPK